MAAGDAARARMLLAPFVAGDTARLEAPVVEIPGVPIPKPRPRFVAGAPPYKTPEQEAQERAVGLMLRTRGYPRPLENWVAVVMLFFRPTKHRVDVDNLAKLVMDAANGIAYADDSQVRAIVAEMEIDKDDPRTVVVVAPHLANYHSGRLIG